MSIDAPNTEDRERIARQWLRAESLVREHCDAQLESTLADLDILQELLDKNALQADQTYDLQCLGIALGRILIANSEGLDWAMLDDEYGRDPTIRYRNSTLTVNVLTQISKRVERGEDVRVRLLFEQNVAHIRKLSENAT